MSRSDALLIEYAQNRKAWRESGAQVRRLMYGDKGDCKVRIDLSSYREAWLGVGYYWAGWVAALNDADEPSDAEMELAKVLDRRAELRVEAGHIKRRIYRAGAELIKKAEKAVEAQ